MSEKIQSIQNNVFGNKNKSGVIDTLIRIMETFGYTLEEVKQLPIPTYEYMVKYLNKVDAAKIKANKKGKKK